MPLSRLSLTRHSRAVVALLLLTTSGITLACTTLKECAEVRGTKFGCAIGIDALTGRTEVDNNFRQEVIRNCACITPEADWKMGNLFQAMTGERTGYFTLGIAKRYIDFAAQNNMCVNGHVLVWHGKIDGTNGPGRVRNWNMGQADWQDWLEEYVTRVVETLTRYSIEQHGKNVIERWDVVSEAFVDPEVDGDQTGDGFNGPNGWRDTLWFRNIGTQYFSLSFQWARAATESLRVELGNVVGVPKLFYIDYSCELDNSKSRLVLNRLTQRISDGVPIDGFGFQAHISFVPGDFYESVGRNVLAFQLSNIAELAILEMDVFQGECRSPTYYEDQAYIYENFAMIASGATKMKYFHTWYALLQTY